ncbi:MAG: ATP-dependent DNA helicase RecG [Patescibacteria group bacterium]|nr:ATP-dependent DNA helicase RecG [Patescibacteria group bacterium]
MGRIQPSTLLTEVQGIGPRFLDKLKKLKIETVKDLLWHFPTRYEDYSQIYKIADLQPNQNATIQGIIKDVGGRRTWRRRLFIVEALVSDDSGSIRAVWFNQPYIRNILRPGRTANFSGKITTGEDEIYLSNPVYELIDIGQQETKHTGRIVPIYPETRGLTSKGLRYLIKPILGAGIKPPETIPQEILKRESLPEINIAIRDVHFPPSLDKALIAKKRFAFEDLFFLQLYNLLERLKLSKEKAVSVTTDIEEIRKLTSALTFELTSTQKKSLWEILQDIGKPHPMNRLLQGDVGSGKTIVAAIAAITAGRLGYQTAFMAPTEILARQHYQTLTNLFQNFEGGIALLTSSEARVSYGHNLETVLKKPSLIKEIADGKVKIAVGTHALIQKNVTFPKLVLVVVDEQHRFGVKQRQSLLVYSKTQDSQKFLPHFLSMSATPIPRTLSLTLFGDLDLSLITELPKNRRPIITKVVAPVNREKAYAFIHGQIKKGRQAFVVCPRIEPDQEPGVANSQQELSKLELKSVKEEYEKLSKKVFPDLSVVMLHGKMKAKEKENIMRDFSEEKIDILVSTSVIEVGVDIPNAVIMMIEGADRFGLAQLYQFRGRVGRGKHQSFCFLFTDSSAKATHQRLKSIVEAKNGLELAEKDLAIRGPGEFLGTGQTGIPDLAMKALQNPGLVQSAREAATKILEKDSSLKNYPLLAENLERFRKEIHRE